jgi:hypothetical protein
MLRFWMCNDRLELPAFQAQDYPAQHHNIGYIYNGETG